MRGYCVIGKSLSHTLSPQLHALFGDDAYAVRELEEDAVKDFVTSREFCGFNVTIPYKQTVMPHLDGISEVARAVGAVNTVVEEDGKLVGYNTDVGGMAGALRLAGISLEGKNVMVLGSGGASKTAQYLSRSQGSKSVRVVSRRGGQYDYVNCYELLDTDVIVNATPVGMYPHADDSPIDLTRFCGLQGVFDAIYNPLCTKLVMSARSLGVPAANGLFMLVEQGRLAHNLFMKAAGREEIDESFSVKAYETLLKRLKNVTLIGMSGSGKTFIGRRLAAALDREFFDTDEMIEKAAGMSVPDVFATHGEEEFRRLEREAVEQACSGFGRVISVGGGAPLSPENLFFIKANGAAVWLKRDPDKLSVSGRPLTRDLASAKALYEKRKGAYSAAADFAVVNEGDPRAVVKEIAKFLEEK